MGELDDLLEQTIEKFRRKVEEDAELRRELEGFHKKVNIDVLEGEGYGFVIDDGEVRDYAKGKLEQADITVSATEEDLIALFKGELKPMKAWATKRLRLQGDLADVLKFRRFL